MIVLQQEGQDPTAYINNNNKLDVNNDVVNTSVHNQ